jgi:predicted DNA-binding transcriptional regulator AlpA
MPNKPSSQPEEDRLIDVLELQRRWKIHRSVLRRMIEDGRCPPPLLLGPASRRWWLSDIRDAEARFRPGKIPVPTPAAAAKKERREARA